MESFQCLICAHYKMLGECDAFPNGIPKDIFTGKIDHTKPYAGDHGIQYKER